MQAKLVMGVKQHLVGLQQIGPHEKSPAVRKLELYPSGVTRLARFRVPERFYAAKSAL
jgi:hypothetical protein